MAVETAERRGRRRSNPAQAHELRVSFSDARGNRQGVQARVLDHTPEGLGLHLPAPLTEGQTVTLRPGAGLRATLGELPHRARVLWCVCMSGGGFRAGLAYESHGGADAHEEHHSEPLPPVQEDLYEVLMVNPRADLETIHRIYRLQAQRFHPDNGETGDADHFRLLTQAYSVLGNADRRAAYDVSRQATQQARVRLFTRESGATGAYAERRKRQGVLAALYRRRLLDAAQPTLSVFDLEEVLAVAREHLEFSLWYLKERGLLQRADNNRFQITVQGVDEFERLEAESHPQDRLLAAPAL